MSKLEDIRIQLAELGRINLYFLCKGILGYKLLTPTLHKELCHVIESSEWNKKLILIPRGTFKTTIAVFGRAIQRIIQNPDRRILIACNTVRNAQRRLRKIEGHFEHNALFRWLYQEIIPDFGKVPWSANEMVVVRKSSFAEPTIDIAGVGSAVTGRHYTDQIKDDIVDDKNTNTMELIEDLIDWDSSTIPLFDEPESKGCEELVIGTPWSKADVYSIKREDPDYAVYVRHALEGKDGSPDFEHGIPIFPERLDKERLEKIRMRIANDELFYCQYMCDPRGGAASQFQRDWIQNYVEEPNLLETSITVDPGSLRPDDGDFSAFVVVGIDVRGNMYVLHRYSARLNPREIIETLFDLYRQYPNTHTIGIETVAYQKVLKFFAEEEMRKRSVWLPLRELHTDTRISKEMRIRALIPRFSNKTVFIKSYMTDLVDQLLDFPKGRYDDLIDALAYQLQLIIVPQERKPKVVDPFCIEEILIELIKKNKQGGMAFPTHLADAYVESTVLNKGGIGNA